jgi:ABC-2 type transport system permease protein
MGAVTGSRSLATATSAALAVALFAMEGLAEQVAALRPIRQASPWHWLLSTDPLRRGLLWEAWVLPILVSVVMLGVATAVFARRDLH